ncbi:hypothetical protein D082_29070 [Synechocystis sp. PCC 6714]|nr:hypothetical protein D082_29070 [Synechocystis sp. PCC 6714]
MSWGEWLGLNLDFSPAPGVRDRYLGSRTLKKINLTGVTSYA